MSLVREARGGIVRRDEGRTLEASAFRIEERAIEHRPPRIDGDGKGFSPRLQARGAGGLRHDSEAIGAPELGAGGKREPARSGNGDAHAGEAAGPERRGDQIEITGDEFRFGEHRRHHGHQRLGVTARHALGAGDKLLAVAACTQQRRRAGAHARVEGEDVHPGIGVLENLRHLVEARSRGERGRSTLPSP